MTAPFSALDHVLVGVADLDAAARLWRSFGFTLTPRGDHAGGATANHCIMFRETYIELIGVTGSGGALAETVARRPSGALGVAFASGDAAATAAALRAAGVGANDPVSLTRPLTLDGETQTVAFENVMFEPVLPGILAFACSHLTPRLSRARDEWMLHANGAIGLNEIVILADDPASWLEPLASLFGRHHVADAPHGLSVSLGDVGFAVMNRVGLTARFGGKALEGLPEAPCLAAFSVEVNEPDAAGAMLDMAGVSYHERPNGLVVAARHAGGVIVEFAED